MKKNYYINNLELEINDNEITSIVGSSWHFIIKELKEKYHLNIISNIFKENEKLVKMIISNSKRSMEIIKLLNISHLLEFKYKDLGVEDKVKVMIATHLNSLNEVVVFDDILSYLNNDLKIKIVKYLKKNKVTLISFTSEIEEVLLGENLIVLEDSQIILSGKVEEILNNEKKLKDLGIYLPFIIDLSIQLGLYKLINKIYFDNKKLIGDLWK
jgi:ABC-type cobalamin/Fe3+-siderophores transport system ATPase subunit